MSAHDGKMWDWKTSHWLQGSNYWEPQQTGALKMNKGGTRDERGSASIASNRERSERTLRGSWWLCSTNDWLDGSTPGHRLHSTQLELSCEAMSESRSPLVEWSTLITNACEKSACAASGRQSGR